MIPDRPNRFTEGDNPAAAALRAALLEPCPCKRGLIRRGIIGQAESFISGGEAGLLPETS